jgi:hypothetical protein
VPAQGKPSMVFCHGIWANGSCFTKVIPRLQAGGYEVSACQYGLDSAQADVDTVIRTLGRVSSPSILVGHSYGRPSSPPREPTTASSDSHTSPRLGRMRPKAHPRLRALRGAAHGATTDEAKVLTSRCSPTPTSCLT